MKLLLDTHVLLWALNDPKRLAQRTRDAITDRENDAFVSVATLWEIAIKLRIGKLKANLAAVLRTMELSNFELLPIAPAHLISLVTSPSFHRDPFDHLIVAQAIAENATLVSAETAMASYPVRLMQA